MKLPHAWPAAVLALALALAGCNSEPEAVSQTPVDQELPEANAPVAAEDAAAPDAETPSTMESGSNEKDGRKPDPKRSKLIKADPS